MTIDNGIELYKTHDVLKIVPYFTCQMFFSNHYCIIAIFLVIKLMCSFIDYGV